MSLLVTDDAGEGIDLGKLSAKFEVSNSAASASAFLKMTVYNLSADTIARVSDRYRKIEVVAGYPQRLGTIFRGEIRSIFTTKDGPDKLTEIFAREGALDMENTVASGEFPAGTPVRDVVLALALQAKSVTVNPDTLRFITDATITGALSVDGMLRDELHKLAKSYDFRWMIQGGVFQFVDKSRPFTTPAIKISRETGMIDSPVASSLAIEVLTLLDHNIIPGRRVDIETAGALVSVGDRTLQSVPDFSLKSQSGGLFDVLRVSHIGETRGLPWYTKAYCRQIPTATV